MPCAGSAPVFAAAASHKNTWDGLEEFQGHKIINKVQKGSNICGPEPKIYLHIIIWRKIIGILMSFQSLKH